MTIRDLAQNVGRLLLRAGWAPILVVLAHQCVAGTKWSKPLDFWMHFSGGAAIAFFLFHSLRAFPQWFKTSTILGDLLFAFGLALAIGVFWELGEWASDLVLHTQIQKYVHEILKDLLADTCGAISSLALILLVHLGRSRSNSRH